MGRQSQLAKKQSTWLKILGVVFGTLIVFTIVFISLEDQKLEKIEIEKKVKTPVWLNGTHPVEDINGDATYISQFKDLIKFAHKKNKPDFVFNEEAWTTCLNDTDFFRMYADPVCLGLWLIKLESSNIIGMDKIIGVLTVADEKADPSLRDKAQSNGGVRMFFEDGNSSGYWKPCTLDTGRRETFLTEITSFWIDRLLGFFHTPPVVPRFFTRYELLTLAQIVESQTEPDRDAEAVRKIESFLNLCGSPRQNTTLGIESKGTEGAMVAWSPFTLKTLNGKKRREGIFVRFSDITTEEELEMARSFYFAVNSTSSFEVRQTALEIVSIHMFSIIVGNLKKFDHNLFRAINENLNTQGPFIYIDNDRSQWIRRSEKSSDLKGMNAITKICKFPKAVSQRIRFLRPSNPKNKGNTLGTHILKMASIFTDFKNGPLFTFEEAVILDTNVEYLASIIDDCVKQYGEDNVLIPETWPLPSQYDILQAIEFLSRAPPALVEANGQSTNTISDAASSVQQNFDQ